ncbi:MAG: glycosyltransferase family 2 protein [Beijerinckiaceae bacterium]|nr:glycosyltransferase family 2 protein [Beijerinckiaceae bacterium]
MSDDATISISVILPVYNGGHELLISVRSILDQSFHDWQLIIIDDGSVDGSIEQLVLIKDKRLTIYRNDRNYGIAHSLNTGIDLAVGKYIARMDHDDVCHPKRLEIQYNFLEENHDVDLVGSNYVLLESDNSIKRKIKTPEKHEDITSRPWLGFALAHPTWMARSSWFKNNKYKYPGPYYTEDAELLLRTYKRCKFNVIQEDLLLYKHSNKNYFKMFKVRVSHLLEQLIFFKSNWDYNFLLFPILLFPLHVIKDFLNFDTSQGGVFRRSKFENSQITEAERDFWNARLNKLHADENS